MIEESLEDFRKRYKGTYLFLKVNGKEHLVNYESDDEECFYLNSPTFGSLVVNETSARNDISFYFPKVGLYNLPSGMTEVTRYPARQWKRAPCRDNVGFIAPFEYLSGLLQPRFSFDFFLAQELFFPKYPKNLAAAIGMCTQNKAVALTRSFGVSFGPPKEEYSHLLWYRTTPIGRIYPKTSKIELAHKTLYQETIDYFSKKEPEWTIEQKS